MTEKTASPVLLALNVAESDSLLPNWNAELRTSKRFSTPPAAET